MSRVIGLHILVIDVWMPTPDRDGASLRMVNLLSILRDMAGKLTFGVGESPGWRNYGNGQASIHSLLGPNIELLDGHLAIEAHLKHQGSTYDVVILSRLSMASRYLQRVRQAAPQASLIFDTTDLHFLRGFRAAKVTGKINLLRSALLAKKEELSLAKQADCTLVVSPVEKEILEKECPDIKVHLVSIIQETFGSARSFAERSGIVFVGAFAHHPNVDAMEYFCRDVYPQLEVKLPGVSVTVIGSDPADWLKQASTNDFVVTDYVPDIAPYFGQCRLSIAPLRYGAGVKGKVLLSLGYGVPVVASSMAAEGIPVVHGQDILIADTPETFCDAVVQLYSNETMWSQMSENGLDIVSRYFSFAAAQQALIDLFESLGLEARAM